MRGSRFSKIYLMLFAVILTVGAVFWLMQKYDQESIRVLFVEYCQNREQLKKLSHEIKVFSPELAENVYLEETFDQKILPQIKTFFIDSLKPLGLGRAKNDASFQILLNRDIQAVYSTKNIEELIDTISSQSTNQICNQNLTFIRGVFPQKFLPSNYASTPVIRAPLAQWQAQFIQLKPLAAEVKKQIREDFRTLCQGWKNLDQADQISKFFQMQCQNPRSKKTCSAEQNVKLKSYASGLELQFKENFSKFKKKWSKVQIGLDQMKKRCL
jgi:hypothetical protein